MLKSKKGYLASELFDYKVKDRHSKRIGKISELLINSQSYKIDYIIVGRKKWLVPVSFINSDDSRKKEIIISQPKDRIVHPRTTRVFSKNCYHFSDIKKFIVYDITGLELGLITNIAYYPGLRVDFLVQKEVIREESQKNEIRFPNYFVIPVDCICQFHKRSVILGISKDELNLVNFTGFHHLFLPYQVFDSKKRYVIVEAPTTTASYYLTQRLEALNLASESFFIEELDVSRNTKVRQFVKLFNLVLATSPDTYIPLTTEDARRYFKHGTFIAIEHYRPIGYCFVTIGKQKVTNQKIGVIAGIGVRPSCRGRSIAIALIDKSLRYMIDKDVERIQADIYEINMPSLRLFSSLGFREVGETYLA
ncbi:MAG: GNAT family N-acetyltransferase [Promethearchaeota archaeon]